MILFRQQWKPGRARKDKMFIARPYRELNVYEVKLHTWIMDKLSKSPEILTVMEAALYNTSIPEVEGYKSYEYKHWFYGEGQKTNKPAPRRYLSQPQALGWDIFWAVEDATTADVDMTSYEAYLAFLRGQSEYKSAHFISSCVELAICLLSPEAVEQKAGAGREMWQWIEDVCHFYARSFFYTPWHGALKETYFERHIKQVLKEQDSILKLRPTSEVNDLKYMVDFVLQDTLTGKIVAGVSVKGYSYHFGKLKGTSSYLKEGEKREERGHNLFKKEQKASVYVIISGDEQSRNEELLFPQVRSMLAGLTMKTPDDKYWQ